MLRAVGGFRAFPSLGPAGASETAISFQKSGRTAGEPPQ